MTALRFALLGTGFWARYQLAAWRELAGAECVALYNRTRSKAEALGREMGIGAVYDDAEELLRREDVDFLDVVTDPSTHARFVELAVAHRKPVICQKPMANDLATAERMVRACREAGVPLFIHENWRWQAPIRALKAVLDEGSLGRVFRARLTMVSGFELFANQPFLAELEQFVLTDMGSHVLDVARFLFGEAEAVHCRTARVHAHIKGEDVATVVLHMRSGATVRGRARLPGDAVRAGALPGDLRLRRGREGLGRARRRLLDPDDDRGGHARPAASRRRASRGRTRATTSCTRAACRATRTCWRPCAARAARRRPARTT